MINEKKGLIFDIQSYSVHDGPGCRTTCFMGGCYLQCEWCANPESWACKQKIMFAQAKCKHGQGCKRCEGACISKAITFNEEDKLVMDWEACRNCTSFECSKACYNEALRICGKYYTVTDLLKVLERDRQFWGKAGGVTFSGGEPFYQNDFLLAVLKRCREAYINTAIETTAFTNTDIFLNAMKYVDFAFIDVKHMNSDKHKAKTNMRNELILKNIEMLAESDWKGRLVLRIPIIKDFNDNEENMIETAKFMESLGLFEINLLPFHRMGDSKWNQLGKEYAYNKDEATSNEKMLELQEIFLNRRIACYVGSETSF